MHASTETEYRSRERRRSWVKLTLVGCAAAMAWLIASTALTGLASIAVYLHHFPLAPSDPDVVLDLMTERVVELRGLEFQRPVSFTLLTTEEMRLRTEEEESWSREEARDFQIVLAALDFVDDSAIDIYEIMEEFRSTQVVGFYDVEEDSLFVVSDGDSLGPEDRITLGHELVHALQDENLGLDGLCDLQETEMDSEASAGFDALIEGDASLVEDQLFDDLAPHEWLLLLRQALEIGPGAVEDVPPALLTTMYFPYEDGLEFAKYLHAMGGWEAVDEAYDDPPLSTEQILHPQRYVSGDAPVSVPIGPLTDTLGAGWRWVDEDIVGELWMREHLSREISPTMAAWAAEGWGGDRYVVFEKESGDREGAVVLLLRTVWDTYDDTMDFYFAYTEYLRAKTPSGQKEGPGPSLCVETPDYRCVWWSAGEVYVVRAPDSNVGERVRRATREWPSVDWKWSDPAGP